MYVAFNKMMVFILQQKHTHTHIFGHIQTGRHMHRDTHTHMHSVERRWGDFRAFTGRAGVRLSEPWTAHMKLIQCGPLSSVCCSIVL